MLAVHLLVVLLAGIAASPSAAGTGRGTPCSGLYVVQVAVRGMDAIRAVEIDEGGVTIPGVCDLQPPARLRAGHDRTRLMVRWPACRGISGTVRFRADVTAGCTRFVGTLVASRLHRRVVAARPRYDAYGGLAAVSAGATGRFRAAELDGTWWLVTPEGHPFFSAGVNHVTPAGDWAPALGRSPYADAVLARHGSEAAWAVATADRFRSWGVNTVGAWSRTDLFAGRIPYTVILGFHGAAPAVVGWPVGASGRPIRDYFDPAWPAAVTRHAEGARACSTDPYCIGVFTDNELLWGPSAIQVGDYLDAYMTLPAGTAGKQALLQFLAERHGGDVARFNAAWGMDIVDFADLEARASLGSDYQCEPTTRTADRRAFTAFVAARYYRLVHDALRAVDPAVLVLGSRFLSAFTSPEVLAAAGPWVDVLSINDYPFDPTALSLFRQTAGDIFGYLFLDGPFADLDVAHAITGRPVLVTEYSLRGPTPGAANLYPPFFVTLGTQAERADAYERYMDELLARPFVVGAHWFQHFDQPATGRSDGENSRFGVVTIDDEPYPELTARMARMNARSGARPLPAPSGGGAARAARAPRASTGITLGSRTVSIAPPTPDRTGFYVFILPGQNLAGAVGGDPLVLEAGAVDAAGTAPVRLAADATVAVQTVVGDIACVRLRAEGSSGEVACTGGRGHDVRVTREAGLAAPPAVVEPFQGGDAVPGAVTLLVPMEFAHLPVGAALEDCRTTEQYEPAQPAAFTTATVTVTKGAATTALAGEPFACGVDGAEWRREDGPGMLALGLAIFDERVPGGDLASAVRLADRQGDCQ